MAGPKMPRRPVPTSFEWGTFHDPNGKGWVLLTVATPVGTNVYWMPPETAAEVAKGLVEQAQVASKPGIVMPRNGNLGS